MNADLVIIIIVAVLFFYKVLERLIINKYFKRDISLIDEVLFSIFLVILVCFEFSLLRSDKSLMLVIIGGTCILLVLQIAKIISMKGK